MKNKNIYFVGYFQGIEKKIKFVDLFKCKNKFFLESSFQNMDNNLNTQYFPEQIYKLETQIKHLFTTNKIVVDPLTRELYRKDFKHFKSLKINMNMFTSFKKISLLLLFSIEKFNKEQKGLSKLNIFKYVNELKNLLKAYKSKNIHFENKFKNFMFRLNFIIGYNYSKNLLDNLTYDTDDIYIMWGKSYSSRILLLSYLNKHKISHFVSEYGEIPGTISCSPHGIFGEIFSLEAWNELNTKEISENDMIHTEQLLNQIKESQISTRNFESNMYFLIKHFYENSIQKKNTKKIIYVNGAEVFSSALYWNRWNIGNQGKNPNKMLLEKVVSFFNKNDYMIIYKEHPMTFKTNIHALLTQSDFPTVNLIDSMNIHDILDMADIVVTFPSKVAMTSIEYHKKTFVLGDFTIPQSMPSINYFTSRKFEDIKELISSNDTYNYTDYIEFVARLLKYSLIIYDEKLHSNYNRNEEQDKLERILKV